MNRWEIGGKRQRIIARWKARSLSKSTSNARMEKPLFNLRRKLIKHYVDLLENLIDGIKKGGPLGNRSSSMID